MAKEKDEKKEVATTSGNAVMPSFMQGAQVAKTNIESSDLEVPRLKLLQALSKEVEDGERPGEFFHHIAEISIGDTVDFIPIYVFKSYMLWRPQDDGGGLLARAMDAVNWNPPHGEFDVKINKGTKKVTWKLAPTVKESGLDQWGTEDPDNPNSPPAATKMINIVAWLPDHPELSPCIITCQKGTLKPGTRLVSKLGLSRVPLFGQIYTATSEKVPNSKGQEYYSFVFTANGIVQDEALFKQLEGLNKTMAEVSLTIAGEDDLQSEGAATGGEGGGGDEKMAERI